jgi:hypothetical protein
LQFLELLNRLGMPLASGGYHLLRGFIYEIRVFELPLEVPNIIFTATDQLDQSSSICFHINHVVQNQGKISQSGNTLNPPPLNL